MTDISWKMTAKHEDIRMGLPDSKNQVRENKVKLEGALCKQAKCKNDDCTLFNLHCLTIVWKEYKSFS